MQYLASLGNHAVAVGCTNRWCLPLCVCALSHVQLLVTPWTVACQAPLSMGFSKQEYWSGLPCPPTGDLPDPGIEPKSLVSPALAGGFFITVPPGKSYVFLAWALMDYSFIWLDQKIPFLGLLLKPTLKATSENPRRVFRWYTEDKCNLPHALLSLILFNLKRLGSLGI